MREKYKYDSVKVIGILDGILLSVWLILLFFLLIKSDDLERQTFWILASIASSAMICSGARSSVSMHFTADDNAVTFYRFFRKKIAYSSIKSIDLRLEKRMYKTTEGNRTATRPYFTEILTFHCENGDHSFACKSEPSQKTIMCSNNSEIVSPDDTTYSPFSRLKVYIEERIPIMQAD
ncbi:hypothetical protein [Ruminococcus albus]|uniref:Uncharacterized protein n=1 Tax=Ruminococcus albus TaxID=1264 RepID=A0A1H7GMM7_RUMAL|nr:hypothetical protein [Ruminococcus albus]SEK37770.1 hypothetical protein SAMN05216469_102118 [Ruminococcus albus]